MGKNIRKLDLIIAQAEFAYNNSPSQTIGRSPFEVVHGKNPITPIELTPKVIQQRFSADAYERAKQIKKLHEQVKNHILKQNE